LDSYHAVEHLGKISELQKDWKTSEKERWVKKYRKLLINGKSNEVIGEIKKNMQRKKGKDQLKLYVRLGLKPQAIFCRPHGT